ncbi:MULTISPECIES: thioredoxin [unclassified Marinimicrobium]|jgi:putative thioredoxin|uniref:thioredoxin n=1 Tax=unclassified Marinimicrobium TaxID=2632100 RepID=UPI00257FAA42|nr:MULTISPECIES: thioredoxin [unclassified Marinimicrobium]
MNVIDITLDNAQQYVIDESFKRPVLVDFWADWCGPCKTLMPLLEKLADEYNGDFLLARINADEQQMLASQFQVRSLPTVMLIKDGQPLDGFTGAQSEVQVRQMLEQHLPKAWERDLQQAQAMLEAGQFGEALPVLQRVYEESGRNPQIACMVAHAQVELNRLEEAETTLSNVKLADQDTLYEQVKAKIELKKQAAKTPEIESLEQALEADPDNLEMRYKLAVQYNQEGYQKPALELLIEVLRKDLGYADGAARKTLTDIIAALGKGDPLAIEYQRKLFTLLY